MESLKNTIGHYVYFSIEEGLKGQITEEYTENVISLLFNIDGLPLFNNSNQQVWPILALIIHNEYQSQPLIVAVYSGDSKPKTVEEFLNDLVAELNTLILNGVTIGNRIFKIELVGFSCDTPARSFIKKCKGHGGFYACERCETRGKTKNKKRVYPSVISRKRSKRSFIKKTPKRAPSRRHFTILKYTKLRPSKIGIFRLNAFIILGNYKMVIAAIYNTKRVNRECKLKLPRRAIKQLNLNLKKSVQLIPKEFQRKKLDLDKFSYWKATQFRFFLHYCGPLVLHKILPKQMNRHFLLLFVACRILCDSELYIENINYARELLVKFVELLPSFYGVDSQVMNSHNLIHIADDVENTKTYLSNISAFPFENCLGKIKRMITGRTNPLVQLVRRVSEQKACPEMANKNCIHKKKSVIFYNDISYEHKFDLKSIIFRGVELNTSKPNNVVKIKTGEILLITRIIRCEERNIIFHGNIFKDATDAFEFPCQSTKIGIVKLGRLSKTVRVVLLENVLKKCVLFENKNVFAVTYLHES
ncbi:unnamed protein product [Macrosiphum euphorbiae]|uniref:Transposase n=1 Tax=Macrosiphum euphorbiae TaxID=13131 RepID=A0AAV0WSF6_9HEMI|nr:unnamed protein product [Macrosiphum euphorbiae]